MGRLLTLGQLTKAHPAQAGTVALLLLSFSKLSLIVLSAFYRVDAQLSSSPEPLPKYRKTFGHSSVALAAGSQLLYLGFGAA
jgi:hypothetical protein